MAPVVGQASRHSRWVFGHLLLAIFSVFLLAEYIYSSDQLSAPIARSSRLSVRPTRMTRGFRINEVSLCKTSRVDSSLHRKTMMSFSKGDSVDFDDPDSAPPMEIEWSADLANTVNIIGNLGADPQITYLKSGKVVARASVAVSAARNTTNWFDCEMWDSIARSAQQYLHKGTKVYIRGRLDKDTWNDKMTGEKRSRVKVVVTDLNTVRPYMPSSGMDSEHGGMNSYSEGQYNSKQANVDSKRGAEEKWNDFFKEPDQYWDNRALKQSGERSPRYPDFKHKTTQESLWIDSWDSPKWVQAILSQMDDAAKLHEANMQSSPDSIAGEGYFDDQNGVGSGDSPKAPRW